MTSYVPYDELNGRSNIIVDGTGTHGTALVLSHWVGAGTRPELADDLSTQIVFNYLDRPDMHVQAEAVSNNHFDEDGVCGIYAITDPGEGLRRRERLIDVASAGDFATWTDRDSARIAMTLMSFADEDRSPLDASIFSEIYPRQSAALHHATLARFPELLDHPHRFRAFWEDEDARLQASLDALDDGRIVMEERPAIDLAIVRVAESVGTETEPAHPMAIHNATGCFRIVTVRAGRIELRYRYETWVDYRSRPVLPRIDLQPLAERLSAADGATWEAEETDDLTPSLTGPAGVTRDPEAVIEEIAAYLSEAAG